MYHNKCGNNLYANTQNIASSKRSHETQTTIKLLYIMYIILRPILNIPGFPFTIKSGLSRTHVETFSSSMLLRWRDPPWGPCQVFLCKLFSEIYLRRGVILNYMTLICKKIMLFMWTLNICLQNVLPLVEEKFKWFGIKWDGLSHYGM